MIVTHRRGAKEASHGIEIELSNADNRWATARMIRLLDANRRDNDDVYRTTLYEVTTEAMGGSPTEQATKGAALLAVAASMANTIADLAVHLGLAAAWASDDALDAVEEIEIDPEVRRRLVDTLLDATGRAMLRGMEGE